MSNEEMKEEVELKSEEIVEEQKEEESLSSEEVSETKDSQEEPIKEKAKQFGHLSPEEYLKKHGTLDGYKSEREFVQVGEIIDLKKQLKLVLDYQQRTEERAIAKARAELDAQIAEATRVGDTQTAVLLTKEKTAIETESAISKQMESKKLRDEAMQEFLSRNAYWYNDNNPDLLNECKRLNEVYVEAYPDITPKKLTELVETRIKLDHPDRTKKVERPQFGQSSINKTVVESKKESTSFESLSKEHKDLYKTITEFGIQRNLSKTDFIKQLKKDGEI